MSPAKADATRRRLLDAATTDFAAHGIAGARVDRIAAAAGINKAQLYAYFGDKLGLFDAAFRLHADAVADAVPFTATDLAGYAVRLYDAFLARPDLVRLVTWAKLEGIHTGSLGARNTGGRRQTAGGRRGAAAGRGQRLDRTPGHPRPGHRHVPDLVRGEPLRHRGTGRPPRGARPPPPRTGGGGAAVVRPYGRRYGRVMISMLWPSGSPK